MLEEYKILNTRKKGRWTLYEYNEFFVIGHLGLSGVEGKLIGPKDKMMPRWASIQNPLDAPAWWFVKHKDGLTNLLAKIRLDNRIGLVKNKKIKNNYNKM